jgi:hypothetical protein
MPKIPGMEYQISHCGVRVSDLAVGQAIVFGGLPSSGPMRRPQNNDRLRHAGAGTVYLFRRHCASRTNAAKTLRAFIEGH